MKHYILFIILLSCYNLTFSQTVIIKTTEIKTANPIDSVIVKKSISLLNIVFNQIEFKDSLSIQKFTCSNKPILCNSTNYISGKKVYEGFIANDTINISVNIKKLKNPWRRWISKTKGITSTTGRNITTYTWWLKNKPEKELIIAYASHVGHEIFHTNYFKYIHKPKFGTKNFINDKDITYKIDDIIEYLIRKNYR